jgi:hypothetical protein
MKRFEATHHFIEILHFFSVFLKEILSVIEAILKEAKLNHSKQLDRGKKAFDNTYGYVIKYNHFNTNIHEEWSKVSIDNLSNTHNTLCSSVIELVEAAAYFQNSCEMCNMEQQYGGGAQLVLCHRDLFCLYASLLRMQCLLVMLL